MAVLVELAGLYSVFHPSSHWKCAWCHVCKNDIGDFTIPQWSFRTMDDYINGKHMLKKKKQLTVT